MKISRLRLMGFKSFVEPTELIIEPGLTGVVGPNGCGKSNLLEALRWVMGETSHKSMRAAAMDDVIFAGTTTRPAREIAEVTIFLDNSERLAPAEFNEHDVIEITRRIEREEGSAYRINGREARARDVKVLFEDASTGARSPALVRQGQISEIVNAKPEQRRRVLEDAAGIAGLHTRRHEAELRLRGAESNLARLADILGQLGTQVESLKRQARQARRYKDLSHEIRQTEALLCHLLWTDAQAQVDAEEAGLRDTLIELAAVTEDEARALRAEAEAAEAIEPLRQKEAERAAALARIKAEAENLDRERTRTIERRRDLEHQKQVLEADLSREQGLIGEAGEILANLDREQRDLETAESEARVLEDHLHTAHEEAADALATAEKKLATLTDKAAEFRARRKSLEAAEQERTQALARLEGKLTQLVRDAEAASLSAPDTIALRETTAKGHDLAQRLATLETDMLAAEEAAAARRIEAKEKRDAAGDARLTLKSLATERETLAKLLVPKRSDGLSPVLDSLRVAPGFERALAASLGDDLEAPISDDAPLRWRTHPAGTDVPLDPPLPEGAEPLSLYVEAPPELMRRLRQIGVVTEAIGTKLQKSLAPGQRLVTREGALWRWDGFAAAAGGVTPAAQRLAERNRLSGLLKAEEKARTRLSQLAEAETAALEAATAAEDQEKALRATWRETQAALAATREALNVLERRARDTEAKLAAVTTQKAQTEADLADARAFLDETQDALVRLEDEASVEALLAPAQAETAHKRTALSLAANQIANHERDRSLRRARLDAITAERDRWTTRLAGAEGHIQALKDRLAKALSGIEEADALLPLIEQKRQELLDLVSDADLARARAADALAAADQALRTAASSLRDAQAKVAAAREQRVRAETRLENARGRRQDEARRIHELLNAKPEDCLRLSGLAEGAPLPSLADADRQHQRLKAERERLGGVNLQADDELNVVMEQASSMETERADVEQAIAKLRGAISQLNREGKKRLDEAFTMVNGHFQRLFATLFGGGEARLEMIESEDPLEGGLEIIAKPPGKKPATLSLLSGGEQTLTALSLIFAVFLTNPSPICVLDEVDAPLDDANVDRFCTLMEKMAEETATRFLVITHHPMTMTRMNRLFGVTMAEKGVSQLVSVNLETAHSFREAS